MKNKLFSCKNCGKKVPIRSKGLCPACREQQRRSLGEETMLTKQHKIPKLSSKKRKELENKKGEMDLFFDYHIKEIKKYPYCQNCGNKLIGIRSEVAHVLPKRDTMNPEVRSNNNNAVYLCSQYALNNCHKKFDDLQASEKVYKMNVWGKAVEQYLKFKDLVVNVNSITINFDKYLEL